MAVGQLKSGRPLQFFLAGERISNEEIISCADLVYIWQTQSSISCFLFLLLLSLTLQLLVCTKLWDTLMMPSLKSSVRWVTSSRAVRFQLWKDSAIKDNPHDHIWTSRWSHLVVNKICSAHPAGRLKFFQFFQSTNDN